SSCRTSNDYFVPDYLSNTNSSSMTTARAIPPFYLHCWARQPNNRRLERARRQQLGSQHQGESSPHYHQQRQTSQDLPTIFIQWGGGINRRTQSTTGTDLRCGLS